MTEVFKSPVIDSSSRDFEAVRDDLINLIPFFTEEWTDFAPSDPGIVLVELFSYVADNLHFYLDRNALECFLPTAIKRESVINLLRLIDFELGSAAPASVNLRFSIPAALTDDLTIPVATQVSTAGDPPIIFETSTELIMGFSLLTADTPGTAFISIPVADIGNYRTGDLVEIDDDDSAPVQRTVVTVSSGGSILLDATVAAIYTTAESARVAVIAATVGASQGESSGEIVGLSAGTAFQKFELVGNPIIDGTLDMFLAEGGPEVQWDVVDSLFDSGPIDLDVTFTKDEDDLVTIAFGDNANGKIPVNTATIRAEYRLGGGLSGNVGIDTITQVLDTILFLGSPTTVNVTNPSAATGGSERQSIEQAKILGPRSLKALDRAVTEEDYVTLSEGFPGVAKASAQLSGGQVNVFIVPSGGGQPSLTLIADLQVFLDERRMLGVIVVVQPPIFVSIDFGGSVVIKAEFNAEEVETLVDAAIDDFFKITSDNTAIDFARPIFQSDLICVVDNVTGVDHVDLTSLTRVSFATLVIWSGDATFSAITISATTVDELWTVTLTSATTFTVSGTVSGLQTATGTFGVAYVSDSSEIAFTISNVGAPNAAFDKAEIRVSELNGNVELFGAEFPVRGTSTLVFTGGL